MQVQLFLKGAPADFRRTFRKVPRLKKCNAMITTFLGGSTACDLSALAFSFHVSFFRLPRPDGEAACRSDESK